MIYQYIKELIENNNRIIIPDFGAFMIQNSADGKQISFNDFLKFNDGLLINQIIKAEKISKSQASESVKAYIAEIEKAFGQGKAFEISGVGFLIKDEHGNIKFQDKVEQTSAAVDNVKKEVVTPVKETIQRVEKDKEEIPATDSTPIIELAEEKKEESKTIEKPKEESTPKKEIKVDVPEPEKPKVALPPRSNTKPIEKKPIPSKPKTAPMTTERPKVGTTKQHAKSSNAKPTPSGSKSTLVVIIIAVLLIGGLGASYFMGWIGNKNEPVVEQAPVIVAPVDTIVVDTTPIVEEPMVIEEPDHDPNAKKYYIVAGSFKVPSNAEGYQQKLMDDGFDSEIVIRNNGYHTVSYKTFYEWSEALAEWKNMRMSNEETWILVR